MICDISRNPALDRFETMVEGELCVIDYRREGTTIYLTHVGVPRPVGNRGIAAALTQAAFDWARTEGLQIVPVCPYVVAWIKRHRSYRPLLRPL